MAFRAMICVAEGEERERKRTRKEAHTRRQQERKRKSLSSGSCIATSESDTSSSEAAMGRGSRSKIMRAVEDRPGELMTSFGQQILQYVTDEMKMRAPLEERGRMIDVANLASKYYAALRAEAKEKINPGQHAELRTLAEALDSLWAGQLGRAGDILAQRFRAVEANAVERIGWLRARFIEALPPSQITSVPVAMRAEIDKASTERVQVERKRRHRLAGCERSRKGRVERDESAVVDEPVSARGRQREKRGGRGSERWEAKRRQRERMEAGSSQGQLKSSSASLWDSGVRPDSEGEAYDSPQPALEKQLHSGPFAKCKKCPPGSPIARVVRSPADDHEDEEATPVTTAGVEEVAVNANAPTRVWLGDFLCRPTIYRTQHGQAHSICWMGEPLLLWTASHCCQAAARRRQFPKVPFQ